MARKVKPLPSYTNRQALEMLLQEHAYYFVAGELYRVFELNNQYQYCTIDLTESDRTWLNDLINRIEERKDRW